MVLLARPGFTLTLISARRGISTLIEGIIFSYDAAMGLNYGINLHLRSTPKWSMEWKLHIESVT